MALERPPIVVVLIALLTIGYGFGRHLVLLGSLPRSDVAGLTTFIAGVFCLALGIALWQRTFVGWVGGTAFYALWIVDGVIDVAVYGLESLPMVLVGVAVVGSLLATRETFDRPIVPVPELASMPGT